MSAARLTPNPPTSPGALPQQGWARFRRSASEALQWPALSWLNAIEPVRLLHPDGSIRVYGARSSALSGVTSPATNALATAVVLPEAIVLRCTLNLPELNADDLASALVLHAGDFSPFPAEDTAQGWHCSRNSAGQLTAHLAIASRTHIAAHVSSCLETLGGTGWPASAHGLSAENVEVWAGPSSDQAADTPPDTPVIVMRGFAEQARLTRQSRRQRSLLSLLALAAGLCAALAAMPVLVQWQQLGDARAALDNLQAQTRPLIAERERLLETTNRLEVLAGLSGNTADLPRLLQSLTQLLPDDAHLHGLEFNGRQVRISGMASNAAHLIERLGEHPGFSEVRTPSPIARGRDGKESFAVEFSLNGGDREREN